MDHTKHQAHLRIQKTVHFATKHSLSNKGFATVMFIHILPILISFVCVLAACVHIVRTKNKVQMECINKLVSIQKYQQVKINKLLLLNKPIFATYTKIQTAKVQKLAAAASQNWPLVAKLQLKIIALNIKLENLKLSQDIYINEIKTRTRRELYTLQSQLNSHTLITNTRIEDSTPAVEVVSGTGAYRQYKLKSDFKSQQHISTKWRYSFQNYIEKLIKGQSITLNLKDKTKYESCSVTLLNQLNTAGGVKLWAI